MKDGRKHNTLPMGICGAILLLVLAVGCQGTSPLVTHTVHFAVNSRHGTLKAEMNGKSIRSGAQAVKDQTVTVRAEPNEGYETGTWTVTGGTILSGGKSGDKSVTVKIISDMTVKVEFKKKPVQDTPKPPVPGQPEVPPPAIPPQPEHPVPQPPVNPGQEPEGIPVTKLILTDSSGKEITGSTISLELDAQFQIIPVFEPENASDKKLIYNADSALSITENGMVTALKSGTPTVNIRASNGKNYSVTFNIRKNFDMTFDTEKIETDYHESERTFRITKKYTGSEYALTVKPSASWFTYEKTGENTKEEVYTLRISKNKSLFERKASFVFETTNRRNKKTLKTIELIQKANPNPVFRTQWVQGITHPLESDLKSDAAASPLYRKWEESQTTTWFNARKLCYTENFKAVQDSNMCWAMSTADLIHWWMRENKDNLARYIQKKGIRAGMEAYKIYAGEYKGGFGDAGEGEKSSVANVFRKRFPNDGLDLNTAVNWYLRGKDSPLQKEAPPGIVKDVFSGQDDLTNLIISRAVKSKAEFEQMIKEALNEGHAIAVIIKPVKNVLDPLHVVTIWGVVFDEDDSIVELWNSDSNDAYSHIVKFGVHYPGGVPHKINYGAKNDKGDTRIEEVIIMKSAKEQFKTWLDKNGGNKNV
ncbi:MAG: IdeS/Mac family cysteine endopeptidase [Treponema sp.]